MRLGPDTLFAVVVVGIASLGLLFLLTAQPSISPVTCGPEPVGPGNPVLVPSGQARPFQNFTALRSGDVISVWTTSKPYNSSWSYSLYVLTEAQYQTFMANGTGPGGNLLTQPPSTAYWSSGEVRSTANTFQLRNGTWWWIVYNPEPQPIGISFTDLLC